MNCHQIIECQPCIDQDCHFYIKRDLTSECVKSPAEFSGRWVQHLYGNALCKRTTTTTVSPIIISQGEMISNLQVLSWLSCAAVIVLLFYFVKHQVKKCQRRRVLQPVTFDMSYRNNTPTTTTPINPTATTTTTSTTTSVATSTTPVRPPPPQPKKTPRSKRPAPPPPTQPVQHVDPRSRRSSSCPPSINQQVVELQTFNPLPPLNFMNPIVEIEEDAPQLFTSVSSTSTTNFLEVTDSNSNSNSNESSSAAENVSSSTNETIISIPENSNSPPTPRYWTNTVDRDRQSPPTLRHRTNQNN